MSHDSTTRDGSGGAVGASDDSEPSTVVILFCPPDTNMDELPAALTNAGHHTLRVSSPEQLHEAIARVNPALVILDYAENLRTATEELKGTVARFRKLPLLVLTGIGKQVDRRKIIDAGAVGCVARSIPVEELSNFVEAILLRTDAPVSAGTKPDDPLCGLFEASYGSLSSVLAEKWRIFRFDDRDSFDDLHAEALFELWKQFPKFIDYDSETKSFRVAVPQSELEVWVMAVMWNQRKEAIRTTARRTSRDERYAAETPTTTGYREEEEADSRERIKQAISGLSDLSARDREMLIARFVEGLTHKEIALRFGLAVGTASNILAKLAKRLQRSGKGHRS